MLRIKANGKLVRELRIALTGKPSQKKVADLSADHEALGHFKGEVPPRWINEFSAQWLSRVETLQDERFDDSQLKSLAYILGTTFEAITFSEHANPFKGLEAFGIEDAKFFGGRDEEAKAVLEQLSKNTFVGIIGASGSGKSSLAHAGVWPLITAERPNWTVFPIRLGSNPLDSLFYALDAWLFSREQMELPKRIKKFKGLLREDRDALYHYLEGNNREKKQTPVLLVDQWEELYTLCKDQTERHTFLSNVVYAIRKKAVRVLITIRSDFYGDLQCSEPPFFELLKPNLIDLKPMRPLQLRAGIEKSMATTGLQFDEGLIEQLLEDTGSDQGQLPILQFALAKLWSSREVARNRVTFENYKTLGGVKLLIKTHADDVVAQLNEEEEKIARLTLPTLVNFSEFGNDVKSPMPLFSFSEEQQRVLRKLSGDKSRLLTIFRTRDFTKPDQFIEYVELAHEELIRSWPKLREWLNDYPEFHWRLSQLRTSYKQYKRNGEHPDLLLPEGKMLEDAKQLQKEYGDKYLGEIKPFIDASSRKWSEIHNANLEEERKRVQLERHLRTKAEELAKVAEEAARNEKQSALRATEKSLEAEKSAVVAQRNAEIAENNAASAQNRFWLALAFAASSVVGLIAAISGYTTARQTEINLAAAYSMELTERGNYSEAIATVLNQLPRWYDSAFLSQSAAINSLKHAVLASPERIFSHKGHVKLAEFNAAGTRIVTLAGWTARLWDAKTGKLIAKLASKDASHPWVYRVKFSADGTRVATASNKTIRLWDSETGKQVGEDMKHFYDISGIEINIDGTRLITHELGKTRFWDTETNRIIDLGKSLGHFGSAVFNSQGTRMVAVSGSYIRQWDPSNGRQLGADVNIGMSVLSAVFNPSGTRLVATTHDGKSRLLDSDTHVQLGKHFTHSTWSWPVSFNADGSRLVVFSGSKARLLDAATGQQVGNDLTHSSELLSAVLSADGSRIATNTVKGDVQIWHANTTTKIGLKIKHFGTVRSIVFNSDGTRVVTASEDRTARLWDANTGQQVGIDMAHDDWVNSAFFNAGGTQILTASNDGTARLWDADVGWQVNLAVQPRGGTNSAAFNADGTQIVTASNDGTARLWDASKGHQLGPDMDHRGRVGLAKFNPNGAQVVTVSGGHSVRLWHVATGEQVVPVLTHNETVFSAEFSEDGARIVTGSDDGIARVWDTKSGQQIGSDMIHPDAVRSAAFNMDGSRIVTASDDGIARLWDTQLSTQIGQEMMHDGIVYSAVFSEDGAKIVTASHDGTARLWNAKTGERLGADLKHRSSVHYATFNSSAKLVVTVSSDGTARLWDTETNRQIGTDMVHRGTVNAATFDQTGARVATASSDTVHVWDTKTGRQIGPAMNHDFLVDSVSFNSNGTVILTTSRDGYFRLWDADFDQESTILDARQLLFQLIQ